VAVIFSCEAKGKGKAKGAVDPVHTIEIHMDGGGKAPLILNLGIRPGRLNPGI
jgi:hypothetical protein